MPRKYKLDAEEREILRSVEAGEWRVRIPSAAQKRELAAAARAALRKDHRLNIRISKMDLSALKSRAVIEGLPYQTFVASLLHKYVTGRLREA